MLSPPINPLAHYWIIGGAATDVYSSATNTMTPVDDPAYVAWGRQATPIPSEAELAEVLKPYFADRVWLFRADGFIQPTPTTYTVSQLKAYSDDARWRKEQGGLTTTAGFPIMTDDRAQAKITGAYTASVIQPEVVTPWRCADGVVRPLDAAGIAAMNNDLLTHINNCFGVSEDNYIAIDAGEMTTREEIDAAFAAPMTKARKNWL
jgi:hypothetical protein